MSANKRHSTHCQGRSRSSKSRTSDGFVHCNDSTFGSPECSCYGIHFVGCILSQKPLSLFLSRILFHDCLQARRKHPWIRYFAAFVLVFAAFVVVASTVLSLPFLVALISLLISSEIPYVPADVLSGAFRFLRSPAPPSVALSSLIGYYGTFSIVGIWGIMAT